MYINIIFKLIFKTIRRYAYKLKFCMSTIKTMEMLYT